MMMHHTETKGVTYILVYNIPSRNMGVLMGNIDNKTGDKSSGWKKRNILTVSRGTIFGKENKIIDLWKIFQVSQFSFLTYVHSTVIFNS